MNGGEHELAKSINKCFDIKKLKIYEGIKLNH